MRHGCGIGQHRRAGDQGGPAGSIWAVTASSDTPIVEFIAGEPGMAERLLAAHVDDDTGHCRVCSAGPQAGRKVWPCPIHVLALNASRLPGRRR